MLEVTRTYFVGWICRLSSQIAEFFDYLVVSGEEHAALVISVGCLQCQSSLELSQWRKIQEKFRAEIRRSVWCTGFWNQPPHLHEQCTSKI
jgi:hypothetical protein